MWEFNGKVGMSWMHKKEDAILSCTFPSSFIASTATPIPIPTPIVLYPLPSSSPLLLLIHSFLSLFRLLQGPVRNSEESPSSESSNNGATSRIPKVSLSLACFGWMSLITIGFVVAEQRSKLVGQEISKTETVEELENTKKLIEELKTNLERIEKEELEAKEEADLLSVKIEEMEEDIVSEASVEAKAQLDAEKARHAAAVSDLEFVKRELDSLNKEYTCMVSERDVAARKAEDAVAASKEAEKALENLTNELIATKESLSATRAAHLEAEEKRSGIADEEFHKCRLELEEAEEELEKLNKQVLSARVLKSKLDASSSLLLDLKAELAAYMGSKLKEQGNLELKKELEEVKLNIEKAAAEVDSLREASMSLKSELEDEKSILSGLRQSEEMAATAVTTLQEELEKTRSLIAFRRMKEQEDREMMIELPKKLQEVEKEAEEARALLKAAQAELMEAEQEAEQAKALATTLENKLLSTEKEIESAKVSEKFARDAIKALEKTETGKSGNESDPSKVTLTLDEYQELSKRTYKAEEQANARIAAANAQIEKAKELELRSLEKLEELNEELSVRRESLKIATENADRAKEGKLAIEYELRTWITEQEEQQRKADELSPDTDTEVEAIVDAATPLPDQHLSSSNCNDASVLTESAPGTGPASAPEAPAPAPDTKTKKKKKLKSLFPTKVVMFFSKRKTHPAK
ncbi:hypothetical protein Ahy_B10g100300 isoform C [Arachis hypogaea]|uniref:WEB family protein n=1 Tax=Arachis hypogaea TaxID=3818 RepID=A0A444WWC8_ARAHY|nr:hypothetical protein Ahy_B10g100300 isoform C [Arachis hypogaea]